MHVVHPEKDILFTPVSVASCFILCCLQTSPEGDDEEVVESSRPREARVWPVIQWPPGSSVATHCTAKLGPWPPTHGPWSVPPVLPLELLVIVDTGISDKFSQHNRCHTTCIFYLFWVHCHVANTIFFFFQLKAQFKIMWNMVTMLWD